MTVEHHLENLNPEQLKAVKHFEGPILVLAGAGTGKTRVLTRRVANLVLEHKVRPWNILAVTFTNKATQEMKERLEGLLGERSQQLWVATFHSTGLRILRRHAEVMGYKSDFSIYDSQDSKTVVKNILKAQNIDPKKDPPNYFLDKISKAKTQGMLPESYMKLTGVDPLAAEIYDLYQRALVQANAMDFGDLLLNTLLLFKKDREILEKYREQFRFILVDEFQDTNQLQYMLIRLLTGSNNNLLVVGDDDQSIYAFRGATVENILQFEKDFPGAITVKLEQNYRSTSAILDLAHSVIEKNKQRKVKKLWTAGEQGQLVSTYVAYDEGEEAEFIAGEIEQLKDQDVALKDIAIFYRTNAQSRALEESLVNMQIPYRIYGGLKFYERKEVKDLLAYLRLISNPSDNQSFLRVINNPPRGLGAQSIKRIVDSAGAQSTSLWEATQDMALCNAKLKVFVDLIDDLKRTLETAGISGLMDALLKKTGYLKRLQESKDVSAQSRIENIQELKSIAVSAVTLSADNVTAGNDLKSFLDRVALSSGEESPTAQSDDDVTGVEEVENKVSLMTLHLAKGLEYPYVFLTGIEEGLLPHYRSIEEGDVDEERRLCYVGITRAMKQLYLSRAMKRGMFSSGGNSGQEGRFRQPSRFLYDMPSELLSSKGGGIIYEDNSIEKPDWDDDFFDDDDDDFSFSGWGNKKKKKKKKGSLSGYIVPADEL